jgi:hypothetical protein
MCFNITNIPIVVSIPEPLVAESDILCYKLIKIDKKDSSKITAPYRDTYNYTIGKDTPSVVLKPTLQNGIDIEKNEARCEINEGYHSYTTISKAYRNLVGSEECRPIRFLFVDPVPESNNSSRLARCYIPKGSTYYINNESEEYVSSSIRIDEVILEDLIVKDPKF